MENKNGNYRDYGVFIGDIKGMKQTKDAIWGLGDFPD